MTTRTGPDSDERTDPVPAPEERPADDAPGGAGFRFSRRRLLIAALALVGAAALAVWLVAFSPVFAVRAVTVHGAGRIGVQRVLAAADVPHGTPLLRFDSAAVAQRVERLPTVASASVTTSFPSTVTITVTERTAVGVVRSGQRFALVDRTGDQYRKVRARPPRLPLFVVPKGAGAQTTGGAVATVASALNARLRSRIQSIQGLDPNAVTLLMRDGVVVRWGSAARSTEKAHILPALLRQAARHYATQIDVTDPRLPFTH